MKKMKIDELKNWDILTYLRLKRNWMVQSHYSREDIERDFGLKFKNDLEWEEFTDFACDEFDNVKHDLMYATVEAFENNTNN